MGVENGLSKLFNYEAMRRLQAYLNSHNCETQVIAAHTSGSSPDIKSTGTKGMVLNGEPITCAADAQYDISAEAAYAAWAVATSYTTQGTASEVTQDGRHFVCIEAHTSAAADKPLYGANWRTYWKELPRWAVDGAGVVIASSKWLPFLVCALRDGTLRLFKAYDGASVPDAANAIAALAAAKVPAYDPERYVPVAMVAIGDDITVGTSNITTTTNIVVTQMTGLVMPHIDALRKQFT